jgi:hypothetical protein
MVFGAYCTIPQMSNIFISFFVARGNAWINRNSIDRSLIKGGASRLKKLDENREIETSAAEQAAEKWRWRASGAKTPDECNSVTLWLSYDPQGFLRCHTGWSLRCSKLVRARVAQRSLPK